MWKRKDSHPHLMIAYLIAFALGILLMYVGLDNKAHPVTIVGVTIINLSILGVLFFNSADSD